MNKVRRKRISELAEQLQTLKDGSIDWGHSLYGHFIQEGTEA